MKIKCNECFQDIELVKYPEGYYANPCSCVETRIEDVYEEASNQYHSGFNDGFEEGEDFATQQLDQAEEDGEAIGYEQGRKDAVDEMGEVE